MSWEDILKNRKQVPDKKMRDAIDKFVNSKEGKTSIKEVNQHLLKKFGVMAMKSPPRTIRTYLFGWHSDKTEEFDPNTMRADDYYYDLEE